MEYELFRSKLKPLVDCASIINIIEGSSSGEHPHRTAAVGLILERSIEERRKRMLEKVQNSSRQDPTTQPESSTKTPTALISESPAQPLPLAIIPVPQPLSQSSSSSILTSASAKVEAFPESPTISGPEKEAKIEHKPSANTKTDPSSERTVKRACYGCGTIEPPTGSHPHDSRCVFETYGEPPLKCTGCGNWTVGGYNFCINCGGRFEG